MFSSFKVLLNFSLMQYNYLLNKFFQNELNKFKTLSLCNELHVFSMTDTQILRLKVKGQTTLDIKCQRANQLLI